MSKQSATYQQLQAALAGSGCPICDLGQQASSSYLDSLLWESVNDPGIRERLTESLGFCGRHSRQLLTFHGEKVGVAVIQQAVLQRAVERLQQNPPPQSTLVQRLQDKWFNSGAATLDGEYSPRLMPCPGCVQQDQAETRALAILLEHLPGDLEVLLRAAGGLCWPHLQQAFAVTDQPEVHAVLQRLHQVVWTTLREHLHEFIRKNDHRFHSEQMTEDERMAIERSIAVMTGEYPHSREAPTRSQPPSGPAKSDA